MLGAAGESSPLLGPAALWDARRPDELRTPDGSEAVRCSTATFFLLLDTEGPAAVAARALDTLAGTAGGAAAAAAGTAAGATSGGAEGALLREGTTTAVGGAGITCPGLTCVYLHAAY